MTIFPTGIDSPTNPDPDTPRDVISLAGEVTFLNEAVVALERIDVGPTLINVKGFGATGSGITDDTASVQAAITTAKAEGGVTKFPPGSYLVSSALNVAGTSSSSIVIEGSGWGSQILIANGANCYAFSTNPSMSGDGQTTAGLIVRDLYIAANGANQTTDGGGIYGQGCLFCHFEKVKVDSPFNAGLYFYQDGAGNTGYQSVITDCWVNNGSNTNGGNGYGLLLQAQDEVRITDCLFAGNGRTAASQAHQVYDRSGLNIYKGNIFLGGPAGVTGLKIEGVRATVADNIFDGINGHAMRLNGGSHTVHDCTFLNVGNGGTSYTGIFIDNVSGSNIHDNLFIAASGGADSGIDIANGATDSHIHDNDVTNLNGGGSWQNGGINIGGMGNGNVIRNNPGFNPYVVTTPGFPSTTTTYTNNTGVDVIAYINNGTGAMTTTLNGATGPAVGASSTRDILIPAGGTFKPTYGSGTPTWVFQGN